VNGLNNSEKSRDKIYIIALLFFRIVLVGFFIIDAYGKEMSEHMETILLIKLIVLGLYVFGASLLSVNKIGVYIELIVILGLMLFLGHKELAMLAVFPLAVSAVSASKKIDIGLMSVMFFAIILYAFGLNLLAVGFSLGFVAFFMIKELEKTEREKEIKRLVLISSEREEKNRRLENEVLLREKETENLMDVFIRTKSLNEKIDIDELITELLNAPKAFFKAEYVALYVIDEDRYRMLETTGDSKRFHLEKVVPLKEGAEPIIDNNRMRIPIKLERSAWGLIDIYGKREEVMNGQKITINFNEDDYVTIATYISQVMFSIKHAKLLAQTEIMAQTDGLTKLANRRHFENQFDYLLKQARRGYKLALIMLDIDHFKSFNDTYGHQKGDEALIIVSEVLQTYLREMDVVGRTGGEEFSILVHNADEQVPIIADRLRKKISLVPFVKQITVSMGIAYYGEDGKTIEELTKNADKALYWSKEHGRNQVKEYKTIIDEDK